MAEVKKTNGMILAAMQAVMANVEVVATVDNVEITGADVVAYCEKTLDQMARKAEKAKETAKAKRAATDALRAQVAELLTDEFQSAQALTDQIGDEEVTKSKVVSRLTALVNDGIAVKEQMKTEEGKKAMFYKLADTQPADAE